MGPESELHRRERRPRRLAAAARAAEEVVLAIALLAMAALPVVEFIGRPLFGGGIPGASDYLRHLTLWVGFLGAMVASRADQHLKIGTIIDLLPARAADGARLFGAGAGVAVCAGLCWASVQLVIVEAPALPAAWRAWLPGPFHPALAALGLFDAGSLAKVGGQVPVWIAEAVMPVGFAVMTVRTIGRAAPNRRGRLVAALGLVVALLLATVLAPYASRLVLPGIALLFVAAGCGAPIFVLLGGTALLLFWGGGVSVAAIPTETYRIVTSPIFPTIPIFAMVGFILSETGTSRRLGRLFDGWFAWLPGGTAVAVTLLCAFFTTFTGASGVTILALGGLLLPVLLTNGFSERFSMGLLTATGSLGLLLPPSLVVILYSVVAHVPITAMFKAALLPGGLLVALICIACVWRGVRDGVGRTPFRPAEATRALVRSGWEVAMPVLALVLIFGGIGTLVEAAAVTAVYALAVEGLWYRDLELRDLARVLVRCATLVGGILLLLGVAMGLTSYLVDAEIPMRAAEWARLHIHSRWTFLLALNVALIGVGCLMDIYSALVVVVPLLLPMAEAFAVHPIHLGVIFLANLQLGYLTPPVGMNLFLAAFRFDKPLLAVSRSTLPFLLLLLGAVLLITYLPGLTLGVLD
jgi:C4-dicarboxylate transporter DctM subunit